MKKIINLLIVGCMGAALVGCSNVEMNREDDIKISQSTEDSSAVEEVTETNKETEASDTIKDGYYNASLDSNGKDKIGIEDEWGNLPAIAYNIVIDGDKLIISGSMNYTEKNDFADCETSDDYDHVFIFDENTEFFWATGEEKTETFEANDFVKNLENIKDSGLGLGVHVEDGVAKEVSVAP